MNFTSESFEKQIKRIHDVLVQDSGKVTWNDRIPDPDNPKQGRQIDITVRTGGKLFHIECRHHKEPQDTKWIEELYGRKISLQADAMVGVSSSGFTEGAKKKAIRLGIFISGSSEINADDIKSLENQTIISFNYYKFSNLALRIFLKTLVGISSENDLKLEIFKKSKYFDSLFNQVKYQLSENSDFSFPYGFNFDRILCSDFSFFDKEVIGVSLRGDVDRLSIDYSCPSMWNLETGASTSLAYIEKSENESIEIIKSSSGFSSVTIDLSIAPKPPPNSVFYGCEFAKLPGSKNYPPKFNIIGYHEYPFELMEADILIADIAK